MQKKDSENTELSLQVSQLMLEKTLDAVLVADVQTHKFIYANSAACRLFSRSLPELLNMGVHDIHPQDKLQMVMDTFARQVVGEFSVGRDLPVVTAGGKVIPMDVQTIPLALEGRKCLLGVFKDVTQRHDCEERVHAIEGRLRVAIEALPMGLHMYDLDEKNRLVFCGTNAAADRILGLDNRQFMGKTIEEAFPPLVGTNVPREYRRVALEGGVWREEQVIYKDARIHGAFEVVAFQTRPRQMAALFWDISERRKSEETMRELTAAVNAVAETVIVTDKKGIVQYVNPHFEKMTGYKPIEILGQPIGMLKSGKQNDEFYRRMWDVLKSGNTWNGIFINKRKDGTLFEEEATISPIPDAEGNVLHYVAVKRDMTLQRDLERRVMRSQKMAALGQLAYRVAHDTANSLSIIMGSAGVISSATDSEKIKLLVKDINAAVENIATFSSSLMAFSHPAQAALKVFSLDKVVKGIEPMLEGSCGAGIDLALELEPGCRAAIDTSQMEQVVMHMLVNSIEAIESCGKITIRVKHGTMPVQSSGLEGEIELSSQRPAVILEVEDSGCGMKQEDCEKAFEPFYTTKKEKRRHAGLGLATVYNIVARHDGDISMESNPGQGTRVRVCIPAAV